MGFLEKLSVRFGGGSKQSISEEQLIIEAMRDLQAEFDSLRSLLNATDDDDMIEYYAHKYKALDAHYSYLLKQARTLGISCKPKPVETVVR